MKFLLSIFTAALVFATAAHAHDILSNGDDLTCQPERTLVVPQLNNLRPQDFFDIELPSPNFSELKDCIEIRYKRDNTNNAMSAITTIWAKPGKRINRTLGLVFFRYIQNPSDGETSGPEDICAQADVDYDVNASSMTCIVPLAPGFEDSGNIARYRLKAIGVKNLSAVTIRVQVRRARVRTSPTATLSAEELEKMRERLSKLENRRSGIRQQPTE